MRHVRPLVITASAISALALGVAAIVSAAPPQRDRKPPATPTVNGNRSTTDLRPVFHLSATDDRTAPSRLRFRCAIDADALRPCSRIFRAPRLQLGQHLLRVRVLDLAGNLSKPATFAFTVVGTWNAAADFAKAPNAANPGRDRYGNTTWFYLYSRTTAHEPSDYQLLTHFQALDPSLEVWHSVPNPPFSHAGVMVGWSFGRITIHPGNPNLRQNAIVGWRSPITASVRVSATVWHNQNTCAVPQNGILWSIDQGASTLRSGRLAPGESITVDLTTSVAVNDALYVVVDADGNSECDGTFVDLALASL